MPTTDVSLITDLTYRDKPLISSEDYKLKIDVSEDFKMQTIQKIRIYITE